jgi:hypothetical protein
MRAFSAPGPRRRDRFSTVVATRSNPASPGVGSADVALDGGPGGDGTADSSLGEGADSRLGVPQLASVTPARNKAIGAKRTRFKVGAFYEAIQRAWKAR